jgi:HK97 gp10 family phage protein
VSEAQLQLNLNPTAKLEFQLKAFKAVQEVFQLDIVPEAVRESPVTPAGMEYNQRKFDSMPHRPGTEIDPVRLGGTGHNRQSIEADVVLTPQGPQATLITQSGYGGYLEVGTSKMRAQPYIWPAFLKFKDKIAELMRGR